MSSSILKPHLKMWLITCKFPYSPCESLSSLLKYFTGIFSVKCLIILWTWFKKKEKTQRGKMVFLTVFNLRFLLCFFQIYACMMVFFFSNMIENQLMSTGAFEITLNGKSIIQSMGLFTLLFLSEIWIDWDFDVGNGGNILWWLAMTYLCCSIFTCL